jgi:pimeloyl-ACP methyl ester carboxylesterase
VTELVEVEPGVRLAVQDLGDGRPVVLIAGFGLSHPVWDAEVRKLIAAGHRAVCIDLRGTGGSDRPAGDHSIERHSLDVQAVLEHLDLRQATLVGWSFGGQICFHLAGTAPERIAQLVLVCSNGVRASRSPDFPFGGPPGKVQRLMVDAELEDRFAARAAALEMGFPNGSAPQRDLLDFLLRTFLQMPSWCAVAWYEAYLQTDLTHLLDRVTMPVLQVVGGADPVTSPEGARWLAERLIDTRVVELDGVGHYPMFEAGARFRSALLDFLGTHPPHRHVDHHRSRTV